MSSRLTIPDQFWNQLLDHCFYVDDDRRNERAAFLLCNRSQTTDHTELLCYELRLIDDGELQSSSPTHVAIPSQISTRILKEADDTNRCVVLVHSHPGNVQRFSEQDDKEEEEFFRSCYIRAPRGPHGSIIMWSRLGATARFWHADGTDENCDKIRISGTTLKIIAATEQPPYAAFDRQVRAFGPELQHVLSALHVGVVGAGGIGSAVIELLIRLGVGELSIWDQDLLHISNVSRVFGSAVNDAWCPKVDVAQASAARVGLGTRMNAHGAKITSRNQAESLKKCDVVFGCTDDNYGRAILSRFAVWYCTFVFDTSALIDSAKGIIRSIDGRVTVLRPGAACLRCRKRIDQRLANAESMAESNPAELRRLERFHSCCIP